MFQQIEKALAEYREKGVQLEAIVTHASHVVEKWAFLIYHEGKLYLLVRKSDLEKLGRYVKETPAILDVPILESEPEIARISRGEFVWTKKLED